MFSLSLSVSLSFLLLLLPSLHPAPTLFLIHCSSCNSYITPLSSFWRSVENIEQSLILILTWPQRRHRDYLIGCLFSSPGFFMFATHASHAEMRRRRKRRKHVLLIQYMIVSEKKRKKKTWFHLDLFPLHPSLPECWMMCNFHTQKPSWIIKRHFSSGVRCV